MITINDEYHIEYDSSNGTYNLKHVIPEHVYDAKLKSKFGTIVPEYVQSVTNPSRFSDLMNKLEDMGLVDDNNEMDRYNNALVTLTSKVSTLPIKCKNGMIIDKSGIGYIIQKTTVKNDKPSVKNLIFPSTLKSAVRFVSEEMLSKRIINIDDYIDELAKVNIEV